MTSLGQFGPAARLVLLLTLVLGIGYPLVVTGVAQVAFGSQADGSLVRHGGKVVGSSLVGQAYDDPSYFQGRPSAAGDGYDPLSTSASNLGLDNPELVKQVKERRAAAVKADGTRPAHVAPDALLASGSGLDPQISPEYAAQQVARVARERGLSEARVRSLVAAHTKGRTLGFLGEPRVDLLELNLALDRVG
ncbi:potassium-transporting ATPase subunit KdpC [Marmoricola sp. URHB0036]|uniref:potassium-transporting ATPase subunit KdpC n=1 Tax=Marmoricola sp. URHB0036 TaxID=1298863 RepID=UPI00042A4DF6|nr:potassium-transporting ATPase subunit KdpC [Marmoricola sp. URHB0036]